MADVTINASITAAYTGKQPNARWQVFTSDSVGYVFFLAGQNFQYQKTTNGGSSWGSAVTIHAAGVAQENACFDVWFDKWTPGDTGTKIHTVVIDESTDDVTYRSLDTASDTLGTERTVFAGASFSGLTPCSVSITKSRGGKLMVAYTDGSTEQDAVRSTDEFASTVATANPFESTTDYILLFPGNESDNHDLWAVYWDTSADELSLKTFDDSADSWSEASISTGMTEAGATTISQQWAGSIRHSDNHLILVAWNAVDSGTGDLKCWDINGAGSITAKTDVISNVDDCFCCTIFIDQNNTDLYVGYLGKSDGSEIYQDTVKVYYKKSTDDASTWGSEVPYSEDTGDDFRSIASDLGGTTSRFYLTWIDDDDNDLFGGYTNSVSFTGGTTATIASMLDEISAALNGQQQHLGTVVSALDRITASLNAEQQFLVTTQSTLDRITASLGGEQRFLSTIASSIDEVIASLNVEQADGAASVTIASLNDEITAAINAEQQYFGTIVSSEDEVTAALEATAANLSTITSAEDELTASLQAEQRYPLTIAATQDEDTASLQAMADTVGQIAAMVDEATAALEAAQSFLATIGSTQDEDSASLNVQAQPNVNIAATADEIAAALAVNQSFLVTIGASEDEVAASLEVVRIDSLNIAATADEVSAALAANQVYLLTIGSQADELTSSLNVSVPYTPNITSTLDEVTASLNVVQKFLVTIGASRDETSGDFVTVLVPYTTITGLLDEISMGRLGVTLFINQSDTLTILTTSGDVLVIPTGGAEVLSILTGQSDALVVTGSSAGSLTL